MNGICIAMIGRMNTSMRQTLLSFCDADNFFVSGEIRIYDEANVADQQEIRDVQLKAAIENTFFTIDEIKTEFVGQLNIVEALSIEDALSHADFVIYESIEEPDFESLLNDGYRMYKSNGSDNGFIDLELSSEVIIFHELKRYLGSKIKRIITVGQVMERFCPNAWLINKRDPINLLVQGFMELSPVKVFGISEFSDSVHNHLKQLLKEDVSVEMLGTDIQTYVISLKDEGSVDRIDAVVRSVKKSLNAQSKLTHMTNEIPNYHQILSSDLLSEIFQNSERIQEPFIAEKELSALTKIIMALYDDYHTIQTVATSNNSAVNFIKEKKVIFITSLISREGIIPISMELIENPYIVDNICIQNDFMNHLLEDIISTLTDIRTNF